MRDNGTDRDIAILIANALSDCADLIASINQKLYAPSITTQPVDYEGAIGGTATFNVVAKNVLAYQWQFSNNNGSTWSNTGSSGYNISDTLVLTITEARLSTLYRCKITGLDNTIIYTDSVKIIEAETNNG